MNFHDGTPFNAEAVKFNLERYKTDPRSNVKADLGTVDKVEITGAEPGHPATQQAERRPAEHPDQPGRLHGVAEIDPGARAATSTARRSAPGRSRFVDWQDNDSFMLVRNDKYWKPGLPYLDGINIKIINELNTACARSSPAKPIWSLNLQAPQKAIADRSPNVVGECRRRRWSSTAASSTTAGRRSTTCASARR